jgi:hypothetical protein
VTLHAVGLRRLNLKQCLVRVIHSVATAAAFGIKIDVYTSERQPVLTSYELHCSGRPAYTTISALAERASLQRHNVYQHCPEELDLQSAPADYGL